MTWCNYITIYQKCFVEKNCYLMTNLYSIYCIFIVLWIYLFSTLRAVLRQLYFEYSRNSEWLLFDMCLLMIGEFGAVGYWQWNKTTISCNMECNTGQNWLSCDIFVWFYISVFYANSNLTGSKKSNERETF